MGEYRNRLNNSALWLERIQQHKNVDCTYTIPVHVAHRQTRCQIRCAWCIFIELTPIMFYTRDISIFSYTINIKV